TPLDALGQQPVVVISLVGHQLDHGRLSPSRNQIGLGEDQALGSALRIAAIGVGHVRTDDGLGLQVHRVLGFVGQMSAPILHLGDTALGIRRALPLLIGNFLVGTLAVDPAQVIVGGIFDPFGFGQTAQVLLPVGPVVFAHDAFH